MPQNRRPRIRVVSSSPNYGYSATGEEQPRDSYSHDDEDEVFRPLHESAIERSLYQATLPEDEKWKREPDSCPTTLYRFFAADGLLLYVGVSLNAPNRITQHRHSKEWFVDIASATFSHFPSRTEALEAEAVAINTEKPAMNIVVPTMTRGEWRPPGLTEEQKASFQIQTRRYFEMDADPFIEAWRNGEIERDDERLRYVANFIRLLPPENKPANT